MRPCEGRDPGATPGGKTSFCFTKKNTHRRALRPRPFYFVQSVFHSPMHVALLDQPLVLSLNRAWQVIGHRTVKQALVALNGGDAAQPPALGLDITYARGADGEWDFSRPLGFRPVAWTEWLTLPVREFDLLVRTPRQAVRVPTVVIATHYARVPMRVPRLSREAIYARDGGVCQYTGERVGRRGGNLDHVVPRARGGRDSFENLVWAKREVNAFKADRLPHEAGLRLLRRPRAPGPIPVVATLREARHPDWRHFLTPA
jgi:5-methylcytosine-specific restriction endonuclease McrA